MIELQFYLALLRGFWPFIVAAALAGTVMYILGYSLYIAITGKPYPNEVPQTPRTGLIIKRKGLGKWRTLTANAYSNMLKKA